MSAAETKFSMSPKLMVASVKHRGSYVTLGTTMRELEAWINSKGTEASGYAFCLYYDNLSETPENELISEACIPVSQPFSREGKFQLKELPQVDVARTRHEGSPEQFAMTYGPFLESLLNSGYRFLGPAREYYAAVSDVRGSAPEFLIQQLIAKK